MLTRADVLKVLFEAGGLIPATRSPAHMADNVRAGVQAQPEPAMRERIAQAVAS